MKRVEFTFRSSDQKTPIHAIKWEPESSPHGILQLVHGVAEYLERYEEFARVMCACGLLVIGNDHLGHGESVTTTGDFGYFAEKEGDDCLVKDIRRLGEIARNAYPRIPYFMLGHSMGSFVVRRYVCDYPDQPLDGVILSGTGYQSLRQLRAGRIMAKLIGAVRGWRSKSPFLEKMMFGQVNKHFAPERTPKDWLSRDEAVVDAYIQDSRCGFPLTVNGYYHLLGLMEKMEDEDRLRRMNRDLPVLLIAGEEDPIGNFGKGVKEVAVSFRKLGMKQLDCILYPEMRHEILNEREKEKVYKDIARWIADHESRGDVGDFAS